MRHKVSHLATDSPAANAYRAMGTSMMVAVLNEAQGFPADYWRTGTVPHRATLEAENFTSWGTVQTGTCPPCPMRCRRIITIGEGEEAGKTVHGPEYETLYSFGGLCMVEHARDVLLIHEECNRLGMDTISAGNLVALAMLAEEKGRQVEAPGKGDVPGIMNLLQQMADRSSELGDTLSQGIRSAAADLDLVDEAIHVKGMEPAGYDPRALRPMALAYATSPRGACHLRATFYKPILGGLTKDLDDDALAELFVDFEDRLFLFDCLIMCRFYRDFLTWEDLAVAAGELAGRHISVPELKVLTGELIDRVRRLNYAFGLTADDDKLPGGSSRKYWTISRPSARRSSPGCWPATTAAAAGARKASRRPWRRPCRPLTPRPAPGPSAAPPTQAVGHHQQDGRYDEHEDADGVDLRRHTELHHGVDLQRQRGVAHSRVEEGDDEVVERKHEGQQGPGQDSWVMKGSVTSAKVWSSLAPRSMAASSRECSKPDMRARTTTMTKETMKATCETTMVFKLSPTPAALKPLKSATPNTISGMTRGT